MRTVQIRTLHVLTKTGAVTSWSKSSDCLGQHCDGRPRSLDEWQERKAALAAERGHKIIGQSTSGVEVPADVQDVLVSRLVRNKRNGCVSSVSMSKAELSRAIGDLPRSTEEYLDRTFPADAYEVLLNVVTPCTYKEHTK